MQVLQENWVCSHHASELRVADHPIPVPVDHRQHLLRLLHGAHLNHHEIGAKVGDTDRDYLTQDKLHLFSRYTTLIIFAEHPESIVKMKEEKILKHSLFLKKNNVKKT